MNKEIDNTNLKDDECIELKNTKYKTMLLKGNPIKETKISNDMNNLDKFLETEKTNNKNEPWCKLNKTIKTQKLLEYVEIYKKDKELDKEEEEILISFLKDCLNRKKLQKVKDVIYDKINGFVKEIPALVFTKSTKHFTLKNIEKRISTSRSLPPKKIHGTIKNKNIENDNESKKNKKITIKQPINICNTNLNNADSDIADSDNAVSDNGNSENSENEELNN